MKFFFAFFNETPLAIAINRQNSKIVGLLLANPSIDVNAKIKTKDPNVIFVLNIYFL